MKDFREKYYDTDYVYIPAQGENFDIDISMAAYQHEKYIKQAIESVLSQKTSYKYRLIIGEDKSEDRTREIVMDYQARYPDRIALILWNRNVGMACNGSTRYRFITSNYVAWLEGDDYWTDPYKLQKQIDFLETHPDYVATYHNIRVVDKYGRMIHSVNYFFPYRQAGIYTKDTPKNMDLIGHTSSLVARNYRRKWSEAQKLDYFLCRANGDMKCATELRMLGKVMFMSDIMSCYRRVLDEGSSWSARARGKNHVYLLFQMRKNIAKYIFQYYGQEVYIEQAAKTAYEDAAKRFFLSPTWVNFVPFFQMYLEIIGIKFQKILIK